MGLRAWSHGLLLYRWTVTNGPSEIPEVWEGGSREERQTLISGLRGQGRGTGIGWVVTASSSERAVEIQRERQRGGERERSGERWKERQREKETGDKEKDANRGE